jgi:hypothetical protein
MLFKRVMSDGDIVTAVHVTVGFLLVRPFELDKLTTKSLLQYPTLLVRDDNVN